jgi:hypothetical protein
MVNRRANEQAAITIVSVIRWLELLRVMVFKGANGGSRRPVEDLHLHDRERVTEIPRGRQRSSWRI